MLMELEVETRLVVGNIYLWEKVSGSGEVIPVYIKSGDYYSNNRICNFWHWCEVVDKIVTYELSHCGYNNQGRFYKYHKNYKLEIKVIDL